MRTRQLSQEIIDDYVERYYRKEVTRLDIYNDINSKDIRVSINMINNWIYNKGIQFWDKVVRLKRKDITDKFNISQIKNILRDYDKGMSNNEIIKKYNIGMSELYTMVKENNDLPFIITDYLSKADYNFYTKKVISEIARKFKVDDNTARKWVNTYQEELSKSDKNFWKFTPIKKDEYSKLFKQSNYEEYILKYND